MSGYSFKWARGMWFFVCGSQFIRWICISGKNPRRAFRWNYPSAEEKIWSGYSGLCLPGPLERQICTRHHSDSGQFAQFQSYKWSRLDLWGLYSLWMAPSSKMTNGSPKRILTRKRKDLGDRISLLTLHSSGLGKCCWTILFSVQMHLQ